MAKKKVRPKSKFAEMGKIILENHERQKQGILEAFDIADDIAVATDYAEYVDEEPGVELAEVSEADDSDSHGDADTSNDVEDSQALHVIVQSEGNRNLQMKPAGRPSDENYDKAFRMIYEEGRNEREVFKWYCEKEEIKKPGKHQKNAFKAAMRRRLKKLRKPT